MNKSHPGLGWLLQWENKPGNYICSIIGLLNN